MKLVTLNIWGGHIRQPLLDFIEIHQEIDIFCLQEVYHNAAHTTCTLDGFEVSLDIFSDIGALLPNHQGYFKPVVNNSYGIGVFIRNSIRVIDEGEVKIHDNPIYPGMGPTHQRNLQWVRFQENNQTYTVSNVHGLWNGQGKTDTHERITQSKNIKDFLNTCDGPKILCGDFNLKPDTESLKILEVGMTNLIKTHNITSTRTSFYQKNEKFADYVFVSPEISVNHFEVMKDEVSDHASLFLDFDC
ncbi:MAG: endonuclease/exonuclease/phosphatase family protein [Myxococcota bacterium]